MTENTTGKLLVASPVVSDGVFDQTVIYMLHHDPVGALGVVLNRPSDLAAAELLPRWADHLSTPSELFIGGPVAPDGLVGLAHRRGLDAGTVADQVTTIDLETDPAVTGAEIDQLRLFRGYSGWAPGQLDGELRLGAWFVAEAEVDDLWCREPAALCEAVLRRQSGSTRWFANAPDDPTLN